MRSLESEYSSKVNFIAIDGSNPENSDIVGKFRYDKSANNLLYR